MTKDSTLKMIIFSVMAVVVFWIISSVLFPTGYGVSVSYNMPRVTSYGYNNYGMISLLTSIIQVLFVVFIITLIFGAASLIKNNLIKSEDVESLKGGTLNDVDQEGSEVIENPSEAPETEPSTLEQPETELKKSRKRKNKNTED